MVRKALYKQARSYYENAYRERMKIDRSTWIAGKPNISSTTHVTLMPCS